MSPAEKLTVTISPTATGDGTYMQILSGDAFSLNIVLIAAELEVIDKRPQEVTP